MNKKLFTIIFCEFTERFYFYSLKAILFTHLKLFFPENISKLIFHTFMITTFLSSLLGFFMDNQIGMLKTINCSNYIYLLGGLFQIISAIKTFEKDSINLQVYFLLLGLLLISIGTGGIKTNISNFALEIISAKETEISRYKKATRNFFVFFYFFINLGGFLGLLISPLISNKIVLFSISFCIFLSGALLFQYSFKSSNLNNKKTKREDAFNTIHNLKSFSLKNFKLLCEEISPIIKILLPISCFWMLYDQISSTFIQQTEYLDLKIKSLNLTLKAEQMQALNAIILLILLPFYKYLKISHLNKMITGMFLITLSFLSSFILQMFIVYNQPKTFNILFQIPQLVLLSLAEIFVAVSGFEYLNQIANKIKIVRASKSLLLSLWYVNIALGNLYTLLISYILTNRTLAIELLVFTVLGFGGFVWLILSVKV